MIRIAPSKILPGTGRGTAPLLFWGVVEGRFPTGIAHADVLNEAREYASDRPVVVPLRHEATPLHHVPKKEGRGPPPRSGEDNRCLHTELFASADEAGGAALALAFAHVPNDHRPWLWVQDKTAIRLSGRPYRPGLPRSLRHRLIHVAADKAQDALFALEEGLRCRDLAFVIGEIAGNPAALDFTASRRLSLVSTKHGVPLWLVRLAARHDLGSARMRWDVASAPSPLPQWNTQAPGDPRWQADLFRAHTFQPGQWMLGHDGQHEDLRVFTPDHGGVVSGTADRSLVPEQQTA